MKILVTGASGFVGARLLAALNNMPETSALGAVRSFRPGLDDPARYIELGELGRTSVSASALAGTDVVVHAAARAHVMRDTEADPLAVFRRINVQGTLDLARQAAAAGVRRFVFLSSIKVHGEHTEPNRPWTAESPAAPADPYAVSKHEAEQGLWKLADETRMEVVVVRPPLVHGPGVKANFLAMMELLHRRVPLPLGAIDNRRSIVGLDNLADLIAACAKHPAAANQAFLASDGEDLSTPELLRRLGRALGRPARLLPVPASLLRLAAAAAGKGEVLRRLCGSLQVDISKNRELLGWRPPLDADESLRRTAAWFLAQQRDR